MIILSYSSLPHSDISVSINLIQLIPIVQTWTIRQVNSDSIFNQTALETIKSEEGTRK